MLVCANAFGSDDYFRDQFVAHVAYSVSRRGWRRLFVRHATLVARFAVPWRHCIFCKFSTRRSAYASYLQAFLARCAPLHLPRAGPPAPTFPTGETHFCSARRVAPTFYNATYWTFRGYHTICLPRSNAAVACDSTAANLSAVVAPRGSIIHRQTWNVLKTGFSCAGVDFPKDPPRRRRSCEPLFCLPRSMPERRVITPLIAVVSRHALAADASQHTGVRQSILAQRTVRRHSGSVHARFLCHYLSSNCNALNSKRTIALYARDRRAFLPYRLARGWRRDGRLHCRGMLRA